MIASLTLSDSSRSSVSKCVVSRCYRTSNVRQYLSIYKHALVIRFKSESTLVSEERSRVCMPGRARSEVVRAAVRARNHMLPRRLTEIASIPCIAKHRAYVSMMSSDDPCGKEPCCTYTSPSPSPYLMSPLS
jgi:hypothetical protein